MSRWFAKNTKNPITIDWIKYQLPFDHLPSRVSFHSKMRELLHRHVMRVKGLLL